MKDLFKNFPDTYLEISKRMIQTPSSIARSAFFYVQETGYFKLKESHKAFRKIWIPIYLLWFYQEAVL